MQITKGIALGATLLSLLLSLTTAEYSKAAPQKAKKEWTLLVFVNGHNNLDSYGKDDINEMETVGSTDKINVVVQWGSLTNTSTTRLYVTRDQDAQNVTSKVVMDLKKKVDMGDYKNLIDFVKWGAQNYPAEKYFVALWNHGSGWHRRSPEPYRGISYDDIYNTHISTEQYGTAINEISAALGQKVDIVGNDACLMAMPEIAAEMRNSAHVFLGAEEVEPLEGWPYDALLREWSARPSSTAIEVSRILTEEYVKSYTNGSQGNRSVTLSAFDLTHLPEVENALANLGQTIIALSSDERAKVLETSRRALDFYYSDYKDMGDFVQLLESSGVPGMKSQVTQDLKSALSNFVVANAVSPAYARATGAAFWLPSYNETFEYYKARYKELAFDKNTGWSSALQSLFSGSF